MVRPALLLAIGDYRWPPGRCRAELVSGPGFVQRGPRGPHPTSRPGKLPRCALPSEPCCHCPSLAPGGRGFAAVPIRAASAAAVEPRPACLHADSARLGPVYQHFVAAPAVSPGGHRAKTTGFISGAVVSHTRSSAAPAAPTTHGGVACLSSTTGEAISPPPLKIRPVCFAGRSDPPGGEKPNGFRPASERRGHLAP